MNRYSILWAADDGSQCPSLGRVNGQTEVCAVSADRAWSLVNGRLFADGWLKSEFRAALNIGSDDPCEAEGIQRTR